MITTALVLVGLAVVFAAFLRLSGKIDDLLPAEPMTVADFETLTLPGSPNTYLVCPDGVCAATPDRVSPTFSLPPATLIDRLIEMAPRDGATEIERIDDMSVEMVVRTPIVRWPDRVSVRAYTADGAASVVAIYSRSKYGSSDLGANKARVDRWLEKLEPAD
jgi:uncharacterized protein (DUF1499 family)